MDINELKMDPERTKEVEQFASKLEAAGKLVREAFEFGIEKFADRDPLLAILITMTLGDAHGKIEGLRKNAIGGAELAKSLVAEQQLPSVPLAPVKKEYVN